ncbi:hypothetical protein ACBI99_37625 [Nonomuraea sp. ATR24]|uniref:hypothetical protein n=2 Tax=Nonomuraea TaxID=83681 RepID=UPI0033C64200
MLSTTRRLTAAVCLAGAVACAATTPQSGELFHMTVLRPGDCIAEIYGDLTATLVPCGLPHAAEFSSMYVLPEGPWPGETEAMRKSRAWCADKMRVLPDKRHLVEATAVLPLEHEWPRHRTAYCIAVPRKGELVGRVLK